MFDLTPVISYRIITPPHNNTTPLLRAPERRTDAMRRAVFRSARRPIVADHGRGALVLLSRSSSGLSNHPQRSLLRSKSRDYQEAAATGATARSEPIPAEKHASRDGVTIAEILERRAKAGRLVAMTAASADSDMFKGSVSGLRRFGGEIKADFV